MMLLAMPMPRHADMLHRDAVFSPIFAYLIDVAFDCRRLYARCG